MWLSKASRDALFIFISTFFFLFLFRSVGRFENRGGGGASSNPRLFEVEGFASIQAKIWGGDCPPAPDSQVTTALFFFLRDDHDHDAGVLSNI